MARFIKLITDSGFFFARARAVIPELQVPNTVSFHENINTCYILLETRRFRGPPGKRWSIPADESAWSKLSNDGRAMLEKKASEQKEQGSHVSAEQVASSTSNLSLQLPMKLAQPLVCQPLRRSLRQMDIGRRPEA